jgi:hypothetical protein
VKNPYDAACGKGPSHGFLAAVRLGMTSPSVTWLNYSTPNTDHRILITEYGQLYNKNIPLSDTPRAALPQNSKIRALPLIY